MTCESRQEQVGLLIDAELEEADQVSLFRHLEACVDCRHFLESTVRFRRAAKRDEEDLIRAADQVLPRWSAIARLSRASDPPVRRWLPDWAYGWRLPVPVAVGLAMLLLAGGTLLGAGLTSVSGRSSRLGRTPGTAAVVVVCGLPEVQVLSSRAGNP